MLKSKAYLLLGLIVLTGGILRFYNLGWSRGYPFNPDEMNNIVIPATQLEYPFHPQSFTYGSLTIYLYHFLARGISIITNTPLWQDAQQVVLIGRFVSALLSTLTILVVYKLALKLAKSKKVALFSAVFTSLSVGAVQAAHFATTETILTLAAALLAYFILVIQQKQGWAKGYFWSGLTIGLATGAKLSALIFLPAYALGHVTNLSRPMFFKRNLSFVASLTLAGIIFIITNPYSILDNEGFLSSFYFEKQIATGELPVFFTTQFKNTTAYVFQIVKIFPWIIGWPITILGFLGLIRLVVLGTKKRRLEEYVIFAFLPLFYFAYTASLYVKWTRYMIPMLPFLAIGASHILKKVLSKKNLAATLIILGLIVHQTLHTGAFMSIYTSPDTRIAASAWIHQNIPEGSKLLLEPNDVVALPLDVDNLENRTYGLSWYDFYSLDDGGQIEKQIKLDNLAVALAENDYLVIGSRRIYANRMNKGFPITNQYYSLLFSENLGYKLVQTVSSYPKIMGIKFNDDNAEETFQVFDHPKILIYKNMKNLDQKTLKAQLTTYEQ